MIAGVKATNFLSWSELLFEVKDGITLITGWNETDQTSEGSGKSSIFNAVSWCLFGKLPKETKIDEVIRYGEKSCDVEVILKNGIRIRRTRNPNFLGIYKNLVSEPILGKDAKETQKLIEQLIGFNFDTYCQTVYFAQNNFSKFITASEEEKARILSEIQNLSQFDKARKLCHEKLRDLKTASVQIDAQIDSLARIITIHNNNLQETKASKDKLVQQAEYIKLDLQNKIAEEKKILERLQGLQGQSAKSNAEELKLEVRKVEAKYFSSYDIKKTAESLKFKIDTLRNALVDNKKKLDGLNNPSECPTCGQMVHNRDKINKEIDQLQNVIKEREANILKLSEQLASLNETQYLEIKTQLEELRAKLVEAEQLEKREQNLKAQIEKSEFLIQQHQKQLENSTNLAVNDLDAKIKKLESDIKAESEKLSLYHAQRETNTSLSSKYETLKESFREIKKYVFEGILEFLSAKTNELLVDLFDHPISIRFTNFGEEGELSKIQTLININDKELSLGLLSGGQMRRVELAVSLALNSIVCIKNGFQFRIFDEPFSNLSEFSMNRFLKLFEKLEGSTLIVEHNSLIKNSVHNIVHVEYKDGKSNVSSGA